MELKKGAAVTNVAGEKVGHVDRVVIDPITKEVTHIVVRKGLLLTEDKVVPTSLIGSAQEDRVMLLGGANGLKDMPVFEEKHFIPVHESELRHRAPRPEHAAPLYWYAPTGGVPMGSFIPREPEYVVKTEQHIPEGTVALKEGASVISADEQHVGNLEQVFTDSRTDRATHILISKGLLLKERKLVPTTWIKSVTEDEVRLAVGSPTLEELGEYVEPD